MEPIVLEIPWWTIAVLAFCAALFVFARWRHLSRHWEVVSAEIPFANIGKIEIRPNRQDVQIAHKAWVELATRTAGVAFDPDHDMIVEIYDSWYELFASLRQLARDCPATKVKNDSNTRQLIRTLASVLNDGLRPHLTKWQASFRRWYEAELFNAPSDEAPQDVQRRFPQYTELTSDLREVQKGLLLYIDLLEKLSTDSD